MHATPPETMMEDTPNSSAEEMTPTEKLFNYRELKTGDKIACGLGRDRQPLVRRGMRLVFEQLAAKGDFIRKIVMLHPAQDGGFEAAETEIELISFHPGESEFDGARVTVRRYLIENRPSGIAEAKKLSHFS